VPEIQDISPNGAPAEAALRWFQTSPWDPSDLFVGTTDMHSGPGTRTARIFHLDEPFATLCTGVSE